MRAIGYAVTGLSAAFFAFGIAVLAWVAVESITVVDCGSLDMMSCAKAAQQAAK